jgi:hypothetical protein
MGWSHVNVKDVVCSTLVWCAEGLISDVIQIYSNGVQLLLNDWLSISNEQMYTNCDLGVSQQSRRHFGLGLTLRQ